jgi:hypothetical protein
VFDVGNALVANHSWVVLVDYTLRTSFKAFQTCFLSLSSCISSSHSSSPLNLLGRATAIAYAEAGAKVIATDKDADKLKGLIDVQLIEEGGTTLAARRRYWQLVPPRGWRRMLPEGLRQPPQDWDDVVAQVLLERWLGRELPRSGC